MWTIYRGWGWCGVTFSGDKLSANYEKVCTHLLWPSQQPERARGSMSTCVVSLRVSENQRMSMRIDLGLDFL